MGVWFGRRPKVAKFRDDLDWRMQRTWMLRLLSIDTRGLWSEAWRGKEGVGLVASGTVDAQLPDCLTASLPQAPCSKGPGPGDGV